MPELHLTLDTQIVMIANGMSSIGASDAHLQLKRFFDSAVFLALDKSNQIRTEYEKKMGAESEGRKWLAYLAIHDRVRIHDLSKVPRKLKVEMDNAHFHLGDRKFTRLAMATECKTLVAEESDYSRAVIKVLRNHAEVAVLSAKEACTMISTHASPDPGPQADPPP
ncbi:MAG: hypothetical protein HYR84_15565 [Planctomycetes bacterium]|nr:hypothetical protein [Planctomycetota bacterium]